MVHLTFKRDCLLKSKCNLPKQPLSCTRLCLKYYSAIPLLKCHRNLSVYLLLKHSRIVTVFLVKSFHLLYSFRFLATLSYELWVIGLNSFATQFGGTDKKQLFKKQLFPSEASTKRTITHHRKQQRVVHLNNQKKLFKIKTGSNWGGVGRLVFFYTTPFTCATTAWEACSFR